jgi:hypothetical protein
MALPPLTHSPFLGKEELDSKSLSGRGPQGKGYKKEWDATSNSLMNVGLTPV